MNSTPAEPAASSARTVRDRAALAVGLVAPLLVVVSAAAWFDSLLNRPHETFDISAGGDVETAVPLLAVGVIVAQLAAHARRLEVITVTDARYLARFHSTADRVHSARSADTVVAAG
ncbi:DUF4118 domain-containing protein [Streptomyces sp. NPDC056683]|uniref:DUF4118 domain-containing protein n=1 Tax=Streptomyces sp. NPDC056683 TaxID=3345910 RepID=UPI0036ADCFC6